MIPKKLYIPTSTLNFNNIMSSESISPASFYAIRGYGYKNIEKVCANNLDNRILLYEYCPIYQIEDTERDNYPLIIEIDTSQLSDGVIIEDAGVFYSEQTIYLNALTTVFLFQNKDNINTTLTKSQQSIETKLVNLYKHNLKTIQAYIVKMSKWRGVSIDDVNLNKNKYVENDKRIDRIKGFLYAHILGVKKSPSIEIIQLKKLSRHLYNIWSAVISSSFNTPSVNQKKELDELYGKINNLIAKIIGVDKKIADIFQRELPIEESKSKDIVNIIKKYGRYDIGSFFGIESFKFMPLSVYGIDTDEKLSSLNKHILVLDNFISTLSQTTIKIPTDDLPEVSNLQICQYTGRSKEQSEFLINMFNTFLNESSRDLFLQDRYAFARMGGELFKNRIIEKWEGSQEKSYINGLLKNLKSHTPFNVSNIENLTLKSFATFCQVANDDIEKLDSNLTKNEIVDYKVAFGLWGITFGFAGISKITYNELYDRCGDRFFIQLYKHIYAELHEVKLEGEIPNYITIESKLNQQREDNIAYNHVSNIGKIPNETTQSLNNSQLGLRTDNTSIAIDIEVRQRLEAAIKNGVKGDAKKGDAIIAKLIANNGNWQSTIKEIESDEKLKLGKKTIKSICSVFNISMSQSSKSKAIKNNNTIEAPSLFSGDEVNLSNTLERSLFNRLIWEDDELWNKVQNDIDNNKPKVQEDILWFQEEFRKGDKSKYYAKAHRDNLSVVQTLENYLKKKEYMNEQILKRIIEKIKSIYK